MLICLGGFYGSGRRILAVKLAEKTGFHRYGTSARKLRSFVRLNDGSVKERALRMTDDTMLSALYGNIARDFPLFSKMYRGVVISHSFIREQPRESFFAEARKYFDKVVFVWIDSDESLVHARLEEMVKGGHVRNIKKALKIRAQNIEAFEPTHDEVPVFRCVDAGSREVDALWELVTSIQPR